MRNNRLAAILLVASLTLLASVAFAGGPLIVDPKTRTAYTYGPGTVPVYYDLGNLGVVYDANQNQVIFDNTVGKALVQNGFTSWSTLPTSSFRAGVIGDFSLLGLPNIDSTNITEIIGGPERYGIYVVFDEDGSIMQDFFGAPPSVLGISSPQYSDGTTITMSWTVLNGSAIDPADPNAQNFQGVATHEFGHALGMAHTQTNGAAYFYYDNVGPGTCANLPYASNMSKDDIETMYPYINPSVGGTGLAQANVHTLDDVSSFSDLYPGPGWPNSYGTITGKVTDPTGAELTGVNIIARNLSDPYAGATSTISGEWTQGQLGPDGSFTLHGLKPGAQYVFYVDAIVAGGFPTPPQWFLPGPERFWSAAPSVSTSFDSCRYTTITAMAGKQVKASVPLLHKPGTPMLYILGYGTGVSGLTADGNTAIGNYGRGGPIFTWTAKTGVQLLPNVYSEGNMTAISPNGQFIADDLLDPSTGNATGAWRWDASNGWVQVSKLGICDGYSASSFAVANEGSVFGYVYDDNSCNNYHAFRWNPGNGITVLPSATQKPDGSPANSRIDQVSADGTVAVGWEEANWGGWNAALWTGVSAGGATPHTVTDVNGDPMNEAYTVSGDGSTFAGAAYEGQYPYDGSGWRRLVAGGDLEYFPGIPGGVSITRPYGLSRDGSVMVGFSGDQWWDWVYGPFVWTKQLGTANLDDFVKLMGGDLLGLPTLWTPNAVSADGSTIGGWSYGNLGYTGWVLQIKSAYVCHASGGGKFQTMSVKFPADFNQHLADGDTAGPCQP
jgi:hypothetical protein